MKLALELAYIAPRIGGVLVSGQRGTAKSTAVRAFSMMMWNELPVTLPINATDDRVLGGWDVDALMAGHLQVKEGLLEEAGRKGLLYIDEVNLLDDHIVNLILDVVSTGILVVQRESLERTETAVSFALVGTMNPEEGSLRPQLLDRFGLLVPIDAEKGVEARRCVLERVLEWDAAVQGEAPELVATATDADSRTRLELIDARNRLATVKLTPEMVRLCAEVAAAFDVAGHRGDLVTALAARALAARSGAAAVAPAHIRAVAPLALMHRLPDVSRSGPAEWTEKDDAKLAGVVGGTGEDG